MAAVSNVIQMPAKSTTAKALPLLLPLDSLERTREALTCFEVATALAQRVLAKVDEHGQEAVLNGVRQIFEATTSLIV